MSRVRFSAASSALASLAVLFAVVAWVAPQGAAMLLPAFALVALIIAGLFPGDDLIHRLRRRLSRRRPARPIVARPARISTIRRRVGRALAFALAMRPPPAAAVALTT